MGQLVAQQAPEAVDALVQHMTEHEQALAQAQEGAQQAGGSIPNAFVTWNVSRHDAQNFLSTMTCC